MFRKRIITSILVLCAAVFCAVPAAIAHHSFSAEFDSNTRGEITGVVTQVRYGNPHSRYRVEVSGEDGSKETWELQASSATSLRGQGWTRETLQIGDTVTVEGQMGRNGAKKLFIRGGTLASGEVFGSVPGAQTTPRTDPGRVNADPNTDYGRGQVNPSHPFDITGAWRNSYKFRVTVDDLEPKPTPYTDEGRRILEATHKYDDPALRCIGVGLPRLFGSPYNLDIYDAGDHYLFLYVDHNTPRRIWMDGRNIPHDARPTTNGYSVGHWEGNTLVIETEHLLPAWLDGSGMPMSGEGTRTIERYVFSEDRLSVDRTMTIIDPLYTEPLIRTRGMAREDNLDVSEQDPCDPTNYYVDLLESGLLEDYLNR